jgi:hypothetical protein
VAAAADQRTISARQYEGAVAFSADQKEQKNQSDVRFFSLRRFVSLCQKNTGFILLQIQVLF